MRVNSTFPLKVTIEPSKICKKAGGSVDWSSCIWNWKHLGLQIILVDSNNDPSGWKNVIEL